MVTDFNLQINRQKLSMGFFCRNITEMSLLNQRHFSKSVSPHTEKATVTPKFLHFEMKIKP